MELLTKGKKLVLGSKSPRRQQLLRDLGVNFEVRTKEVNEDYPSDLQSSAIAEYLAHKKAKAFLNELKNDEVILTSDTVVWCNEQSLEKAKDELEATQMLTLLSGKKHQVITGVCLMSPSKVEVFHEVTHVTFRNLSEEDIHYYIQNFKPFDKAGAYGIQEWIGMAAITSIQGSYFNVVGLPTHRVVLELRKF